MTGTFLACHGASPEAAVAGVEDVLRDLDAGPPRVLLALTHGFGKPPGTSGKKSDVN